jgi:hypothetical protein
MREDAAVATVVSPVFVGRHGDLEAVAGAFGHARQGEPAVVIGQRARVPHPVEAGRLHAR